MDDKVFIPKDSLVKIYFKNGTIIEGVVLAWNDKKGLLRSVGSSNRMIVYNPAENVMMVKLILSEEVKALPPEPPPESEEPEEPIAKLAIPVEQAQSPVDIDEPESVEDLKGSMSERTRKLVQYRISQASSERKAVARALQPKPSPVEVVMDFSKQPPKVETKYYESPDFTKYRPIINSRKKNH